MSQRHRMTGECGTMPGTGSLLLLYLQKPRFSVLSSWFSVPGSQFLVLSSWFSVLSSWFSVLGSWFSVPGSWFLVLSSQFSVLGSWFSVLGSWFSVLGSWFSVLGAWFSVLGSWFSVLHHRETSSLAPRCAACGRRLFHRTRRSANTIVSIADPCITNRRCLHRLLDALRRCGYSW
jgi:hypothetical protein